MHSTEAFNHLIKMNANTGKSFDIKDISNITDFALDATNKILRQKLPNGVTRVQFPKSIFEGRAWYNAFTDKIPALGGKRLRSVKTLWPESYTPTKLMKSVEYIKSNSSQYKNALNKAIEEGKDAFRAYGKTEDGISTTLGFIKNDNGEYILKTAYPTWIQ